MGTHFSCNLCCDKCQTSTISEENEENTDFYLTQTNNFPMSFRSNYSKNISDPHDSLLFTNSVRQVDFVNEENRILQCSAILNTTEIPEIPTSSQKSSFFSIQSPH